MVRRRLAKANKPKRKCPTSIMSVTDNAETNVFQRLPVEMIEHILNKLRLADMKSARLVCIQWNQILERRVHYNYPLTNSTLSQLGTRQYKIKELKVVLDELVIPGRFPSEFQRSLLTAKCLNFTVNKYRKESLSRFDGVGVKALLKTCKYIQTLKFDYTHLKACHMTMTGTLDLKDFRLQFLRELQLKVAFGRPAEVITSLLRLDTPCLVTLEVERFNMFATTGTVQDENLYLCLLECLVRNSGTLKNLKLVHNLVNTNPDHPRAYPTELLDQLGKLELETLEIHHKHNRGLWNPFGLIPLEAFETEDWTAANQLLLNQRKLKTFKLNTNSTGLIHKSYRMLIACRNTLTRLEVDISNSTVHFDLRVLQLLPCLTDFSFSSSDFEFGQFPPNLQNIVWNVPLCLKWYIPECRALFADLVTMTLGPLAQRHLNIRVLCYVLFGTDTKLERLTLCRHARASPENGRETRSMYRRRNESLQHALRLQPALYKVEYDDNYVHVTSKPRNNEYHMI